MVNTAVAGSAAPPRIGSFYGTVPDVEVLGLAQAVLGAFGPCRAFHVVDATITGAHLAQAHRALNQGICKETSYPVNEQVLDWTQHALRSRIRSPLDTLWVIRQRSHLLSLLLHMADQAASSSRPDPVRLAWPATHAQLMVLDEEDTVQLQPVTVHELLQHRQVLLHQGARTARSHTPMGSGQALMHLRDFLDGPLYRHLTRVRHSKLPSQRTLRIRWERNLGGPLPRYPCVFCGGHEEDDEEMLVLYDASYVIAKCLGNLLGRLLDHLPRIDSCLARELWVKHGVRWSAVLMSGVIPTEVQDPFAVLRRSSMATEEAVTAYIYGMVDLGHACYSARCVRVGELKRDPPQSKRKQVYDFLSGESHDTPPLRPHGPKPASNPYAPLGGSLERLLFSSPMRANIVARPRIPQWKADVLYPIWVSAVVAVGNDGFRTLSTRSWGVNPFTVVSMDNAAG